MNTIAPAGAVLPADPGRGLSFISEPELAAALLKGPRRQLLEMASEPVSAVEMADRLGETRQRIGYHVRQLVEAGLLEDVEVGRQGAVVEKRYRTRAAYFALAPSLLGSLAARVDSAADRESAAHLVGALHEAQEDLARVLERRTSADEPLQTLTLSTRIRFSSPGQRGAFADALMRALTDVVAHHSDPYEQDGEPEGEPFRLTLTLNPTPS